MVSILFEGISLDSCEHYTADTAKLVHKDKKHGDITDKNPSCVILYMHSYTARRAQTFT